MSLISIRNILIVAICVFSNDALAQDQFKPDVLFSKAVLFGPVPIDLVISRSDPRSPKDNGVTATFSSRANKAPKTFELANPVVPSAEVVAIDLGKEAPPTIEVRLTSGADGSSYHFMYLFSLVNEEILETFRADYEDNYYFRKADCGELKKQADGSYQLIEESVLKIKTSKLQWNKKLKRFERKETKAIPLTLSTLSMTKLHEKPSFKIKPTKTAAKGTTFSLISAQECIQKTDGDACSSEPAEKARWFYVEDAAKKRYWIWENQALESNLTCNTPMDNSEG